MEIISNIFVTSAQVINTVLFKFWGWVFIALWLIYMIRKNNKKVELIERSEHTLLQIIVPKDNDKKELSAEQLFASLHGILRPSGEMAYIQDHISFEIVSHDHLIYFYVWTPKHLKDYVESQVYAQYPTVQITEVDEDYSKKNLLGHKPYTTEIVLSKDEIFPIRTFATFEVDPLAGLTTVLASLSDNEEIWIQMLLEPVDDGWHAKSLQYVDEVKNGKKLGFFDEWQKRRKEIATFWCDRFRELPVTCLSDTPTPHAHQKFVMYTSDRNSLHTHMMVNGIDTKIHYEYVLGDLPVAKHLPKPDMLSTSVMLSRGVLSLPLYPELTDNEVNYIADKVDEFFGE